MFLKHSIDPVVSEVVNRVAELVELPANNAEDLQVVHYDEGQEYKPHQDAFGLISRNINSSLVNQDSAS
jgi:prolyl 4-hydroxylase